jgi:hypothetical protein
MPTSRRIVDSSGEDFYPTPAWATRALLGCESFLGSIWEPACGNGAIAKVLIEEHGLDVRCSDLFDRGFGETGLDFLTTDSQTWWDNIITNPPFNLAEDFVHIGLRTIRSKLALLLRLSFLESTKRYDSIFSKKPPARVWIFSERITFYPNGLQTAGSGTLAYAWFVWDKTSSHSHSRLLWISPGFKSDDYSQAVDIDLEL